jgi:hypothetical protein
MERFLQQIKLIEKHWVENTPLENEHGKTLVPRFITIYLQTLEDKPTNISWAYYVSTWFQKLGDTPDLRKVWVETEWAKWQNTMAHCIQLLPPKEGIPIAA